MESKVGLGSKFTFVLHFRLPGTENSIPPSAYSGSRKSHGSRTSSAAPGLSIDERIGDLERRLARSGSAGSKTSGSHGVSTQVSLRSKPSEIDSLVQAMSSSPRPAEMSNFSAPLRGKKEGQIEIEDSGTPLRTVRVADLDVSHEPVTPTNLGGSSGSSTTRPGYSRHKTSHMTSPRMTSAASRRPQRSPSLSLLSPSASPAQPSKYPEMQPMRILIVEDDAINRAILYKKLTKDFAHEVKQTVHGEEAVGLYQKDQNFDMIFNGPAVSTYDRV